MSYGKLGERRSVKKERSEVVNEDIARKNDGHIPHGGLRAVVRRRMHPEVARFDELLNPRKTGEERRDMPKGPRFKTGPIPANGRAPVGAGGGAGKD